VQGGPDSDSSGGVVRTPVTCHPQPYYADDLRLGVLDEFWRLVLPRLPLEAKCHSLGQGKSLEWDLIGGRPFARGSVCSRD
jgi:hypothetical protein